MPTGDSHGVAPGHGSAKVVEDLSPLADTFRSVFRVGGRIGSGPSVCTSPSPLRQERQTRLGLTATLTATLMDFREFRRPPADGGCEIRIRNELLRPSVKMDRRPLDPPP